MIYRLIITRTDRKNNLTRIIDRGDWLGKLRLAIGGEACKND
jgi:hypothetical protein